MSTPASATTVAGRAAVTRAEATFTEAPTANFTGELSWDQVVALAETAVAPGAPSCAAIVRSAIDADR